MLYKLACQDKTLTIAGEVSLRTVPELLIKAKHLIRQHQIVKLDLSAVQQMDSAGVSAVEEIITCVSSQTSGLMIIPPPAPVQEIMDTFTGRGLDHSVVPQRKGMFENLGDGFIESLQAGRDALIMASEVVYWSLVALFNKNGHRRGAVAQQIILLGNNALPVVALLSFIIGFILSLQSGNQLRIYGGQIFLADLLAITLVREMGPLITAIIVAGRSGSAVASEVATMQVSEEIDALRTMALNPVRYVIVPKFHAITVVMPILVTFSILVAELGGLLIAVSMLDVSVANFVNRSIEVIKLKDLIISLFKSTVFAWLIVIIGAHCGMRVKGGAEGVGKATTAAVVASIFAVIITDALFSLLYL